MALDALEPATQLVDLVGLARIDPRQQLETALRRDAERLDVSGHVLELIYEGYSRFVEVHDVGFTEDDNPIMIAWQVSGGIGNNEPVGWKLLRLDEASGAVVTHQRSLAPREGYKPGDPVMKLITCQL